MKGDYREKRGGRLEREKQGYRQEGREERGGRQRESTKIDQLKTENK